MMGMGISNMMTSVAMEKPAFANQFCVMLIHCPRNRFVPCAGNWSALENCCSSGCDHICHNDRKHSPANNAECFLDENPEVKKDDGCFGQVDVDLVKCLCNVEELENISHHVHR
jgi:hypothetical protein